MSPVIISGTKKAISSSISLFPIFLPDVWWKPAEKLCSVISLENEERML